jgi:hypothetical protein
MDCSDKLWSFSFNYGMHMLNFGDIQESGPVLLCSGLTGVEGWI